jgi:hypothetical protein
MRRALDSLLRDLTLVSIALAIALGWSLFQLASGVSDLITLFFVNYDAENAAAFGSSQPLTWTVGDRVLSFYPLLRGAVQLVVVLAVALFIRSRYEADGTRNFVS